VCFNSSDSNVFSVLKTTEENPPRRGNAAVHIEFVKWIAAFVNIGKIFILAGLDSM